MCRDDVPPRLTDGIETFVRWPVLFGAGHSHFGFDFASGYRSGLSGRTLVAGGEPMADELLRGVALVDAVMAHRRAKGETLEGMDAATLEKTTLGGRALTPALRRWLEQDAAMFELADPEPLQSFLENEFGEEWAEMFDPLGEMLTEPVVMFDGWGADSRRVIYLGKADEHGELSVLTFDTDDMPYACINGPVDVWLAQQAGFLEEEEVYGHVPKAYEPTRKAHAKANFGGYVSFVDGDFSKKLS